MLVRAHGAAQCGHLFCRACIEQLCQNGGVCSVCQKPVKMAQVLSRMDAADGEDGAEGGGGSGGASSSSSAPKPGAIAAAPTMAVIAARGRARTSTTERVRGGIGPGVPDGVA